MGTPEESEDLPERKRRRRLRNKRARPRRPLAQRFNLRKAMFVLPNLFTVSSIFCGFYAIILCLDVPDALAIRRAALAIFFGMFFDMFDGRVARLTRTQSEFGMHLDSLADAISFGAAPAVLLWRWALHDLSPPLGLFAGFVYVACGALRLARFNVIASRESSAGGSGKYFVGLPIPLAAGTVVATVLATYPYMHDDGGSMLVAISDQLELRLAPVVALIETVLLAGLMVSTVRYQTFKKVRPSRRSLSIAFSVALVFTFVALISNAAVGLALLFLIYIASGLFEHLVGYVRRTPQPPIEQPAAAAAEEQPPPSEGAAPKSP